jgi:signal transduction histidine kinase
MEPEQIDEVMRPFGRLATSQYDGPRGSGLGLPISKKLTEALGGRFTFESTLGIGTTATVTLNADT